MISTWAFSLVFWRRQCRGLRPWESHEFPKIQCSCWSWSKWTAVRIHLVCTGSIAHLVGNQKDHYISSIANVFLDGFSSEADQLFLFGPANPIFLYFTKKFPKTSWNLTKVCPGLYFHVKTDWSWIRSYKPGTKQRNSSGWSNPASKNIPIITIMNIALGDVHESCEVCTIMPKEIHFQKNSQVVQIEEINFSSVSWIVNLVLSKPDIDLTWPYVN